MATNTLELVDDDTTSAAIVASIDDILTQILLRLPMRAAVRFKSVSKHWKSLIKDPYFWKRRDPKPDPATGVFLPWTTSSYTVDLTASLCIVDHSWVGYLSFYADNSTIPSLGSNTNVWQSCNGLLLCSITAKQSVTSSSEYYVYNPTTKRSSTLPELACEDKGGMMEIRSMSLAFDPNISPYYKVICVLQIDNEISYFYIYSSGTGVWTESRVQVYAQYDIFGSGTYWNGAIHWMNALSYFNIEDQTLKAMPVPPIGGWKNNYYFGESYGHLYFTKLRNLKTGMVIHVFELRSDYSGWSVKYLVRLTNIRSVLSVVCGKKEEDSFLVLQTHSRYTLPRILRYNLVSGTIDMLEHFQKIASSKCALQYIECLQGV